MEKEKEASVPAPPSLEGSRSSLRRWTLLDTVLLVGAVAGLVTAVLCGALVYHQYLAEKSWEKADQCFVKGIDMVPRVLAGELGVMPQEDGIQRDKRHAPWQRNRSHEDDSHEGHHQGHPGLPMMPLLPDELGLMGERLEEEVAELRDRGFSKPEAPPKVLPQPSDEETSEEHGLQLGLSLDDVKVIKELESHFKSMLLQAMGWLQQRVQAELESNGVSSEDQDSGSSEERPRSFGQMSDSSDAADDDVDDSDDKKCQMMPCVRVRVTYQKDSQIGEGLLHPSLEDKHALPLCSASPCSKDPTKVHKEIQEYLTPYIKALRSKQEVTCFCKDQKEAKRQEGHNFLWKMTCDLMDTAREMIGRKHVEAEDKEDKDSDRHKRQVESPFMEHIIADKKYKSHFTCLSVVLPCLFAVCCLLMLCLHRCVLCLKVKKRRDPYAVSRGPSFIGKAMRTPSIWSLGSEWVNKQELNEKTNIPPSYNCYVTEAPLYEEVMKQAPPSYAFVQQSGQDATKDDLSKEDQKEPDV